MQRDRAHARVLTAQRDRTGSRISSFQPLRILHVTGSDVLFATRADDGLDEVEILEAARAAVAFHDFLDRTAEVDVDEFGREDVGDERRRFAHRHRIGAEDLHADRALVGPKAQLADRRFVLAANPFGRQEFGDDDVCAKAAAQPAKRRLRNACHGCEVQRHARADRERKPFHSFKLRERRSASNISI